MLTYVRVINPTFLFNGQMQLLPLFYSVRVVSRNHNLLIIQLYVSIILPAWMPYLITLRCGCNILWQGGKGKCDIHVLVQDALVD